MSKTIVSMVIILILSSLSFAQDFSSPKSTVKTYQDALDKGNKDLIKRSFEPPASNFYISNNRDGKGPQCSIQKADKYSSAEIKRWNKMGILPPLKNGDFEVVQVCLATNKPEKFHFTLRKFDKEWKIISHSSANAPE